MRRTAALTAFVLIVTVVAAPTLARAADPDHTVVLNSGDSVYGSPLELLGASPAGVVYRADDADVTMVKATGQSAQSSTIPGSANVFVQGDLIVAAESEGLTYRNFTGSSSGSAAYDANQTVVGAAADGWVLRTDSSDPDCYDYLYSYSEGCSQAQTFSYVPAAGGTATDLGAPDGDDGGFDDVLVGPTGVAVVYYEGSSYHLGFRAFAGGGWNDIATCACSSSDVELQDIDGEALLWREDDGDGGPLHRQPLTGTGGVLLPAVTDAEYGAAQLTTTSVLLSDCNQPASVYSIPKTGGSWTKSTIAAMSSFDCNQGFEGAGSGVVASTSSGEPTATAGLYLITGATSVPLRLASTTARGLYAGSVALSAGRVVWTDDSRADFPAFQRSLSGSGASFAAAPKSLIATDVYPYTISASGGRTYYADSEVDNGGIVTDGGAPAVLTGRTPASAHAISGHRYLAYGAYGYELDDVATGASAVLDDDVSNPRLFGDALAYEKRLSNDDVAIVVRNLTSGAETTIRAAADDGVVLSALGGDYVAWMTGDYAQIDPSCDPDEDYCPENWHATLQYRNFRTMAAPLTVPFVSADDYSTQVALTGAQVVVAHIDCGELGCVTTVDAANLGTTALQPVRTITASNSLYDDSFALHGTTVAWIGSSGEPKVSSWGADQARPRHLGDPVASSVFTTAQGPWTGEWIFTKPLPTCSVTIRSGSTVVRVLNCANTNGAARVTWDGRNASNVPVPTGAYTWTLTGGDSTGSILNSDGSSTAPFGVIAVSQATQASAIAIGVSRTTVTAGGSATISGGLRSGSAGIAGAAVSVWAKPSGGSASVLRTITTNGAGAYSVDVRPTRTTSYYVTFAGNAGAQPMTSATVSVSVRAKVTMSLSKSSVKKGKSVRFSGSVSPNAKSQRVTLQVLKGGHWKAVKSQKLTRSSGYKFKVKTKSTKDYRYRVSIGAASGVLAATSASKKLNVRK